MRLGKATAFTISGFPCHHVLDLWDTTKIQGDRMSRSFKSHLKHFINEQGLVSESLSNPVRKFVKNLGLIVSGVTSPPPPQPETTTNLMCWRVVQRKACVGKIDASIELGSFYIIWHCLKCGDHGSISGWQDTFWDKGHR